MADEIINETPDTQDSRPAGEQAAQEAGSKSLAFLDSLTDGADETQAAATTTEDGNAEAVQDGEKEATEVTPNQATAPDTNKPAQEKDDEAELLEVVKSPRGQDRVRKIIEEKKQLEQDIEDFKGLVHSSGMSAEEFSLSLEFGRLSKSSDEKDLRVALEIIESKRLELCQRLGVENPGVDLLVGHADLQQSVDNLEITRDRALEIANYRNSQAQQQAVYQQQAAQQKDLETYNSTVKAAAQSMESYLSTRASEADHPAKLAAIEKHFSDPKALQDFVDTYKPEQWAKTIKFMYDNIVVSKPAARQTQQPIRSRPTSLGVADLAKLDPIERLSRRAEEMGL